MGLESFSESFKVLSERSGVAMHSHLSVSKERLMRVAVDEISVQASKEDSGDVTLKIGAS
jgi:hypothetical protein